jgi:hypothetical protein
MKKQNIYLIASYITKPKNPRMTHVPGYMKDPANHQYDEQVAIVTRLKPRDMQAKVVINLATKQVERNSFNGKKDFDELFDYFYQGYDKYIKQVMDQIDPEYLKEYESKISKSNEGQEEASSGSQRTAEAESTNA